jgi:hypothetical protein
MGATGCNPFLSIIFGLLPEGDFAVKSCTVVVLERLSGAP